MSASPVNGQRGMFLFKKKKLKNLLSVYIDVQISSLSSITADRCVFSIAEAEEIQISVPWGHVSGQYKYAIASRDRPD